MPHSASTSVSASTSATHSTSTGQDSQTDTTKARKQLPNTGGTTSISTTLLGMLAGLTGLSLVAKRRKRDDED